MKRNGTAFVLDALAQTFGSIHSLEWTDELTESWFVNLGPALRQNGHYKAADLPIRLRELFAVVARDTPWVGLLRHAVSSVLNKSDRNGTARLDALRMLRTVLPYDIIELASDHSRKELLATLCTHRVRALFDAGVADAHVHSGGAAPMSAALELVIKGSVTSLSKNLSLIDSVPDSPFEPDLVGKDVTGRTLVHVYPMLAGLCWVAAVLAEGVGSWRENAGLRGGVPGQWAHDGQFWFRIAMLARKQQDLRYRDLVPLWEGIRMLADAELVPNFTRLRREMQQVFGNGHNFRPDRETTVLLRGIVTTIGVLHMVITSPLRSYLDEFADRFALLSRFRKVHDLLGDDSFDTGAGLNSAASRVSSAVRYMCADTSLTRLELRKTVKPSSPGRVSLAKKEILNDVRDHLIGVRDYLQEARGSLVVQMPVSFVRNTIQEQDSLLHEDGVDTVLSRRSHRFPLPSALAISHAIAQVVNDRPELWSFIGGVDVAGREDNCPNWVFGIAYRYLDGLLSTEPRRRPFVYSIHAGEYFASPLQGLRRIGEVLMFETPVSRIGHCLALDPDREQVGGLSYPYRAAEFLDDLCWAYNFTESSGAQLPGATVLSLAEWLRKLAGAVFGIEVEPSVLGRWYARRFSTAALAEIGVSALRPHGDLTDDTVAGASIESDVPREFEDLANVLLAAFVFRGKFRYRGASIPPVEYDGNYRLLTGSGELRELAAELYRLLRPHVVEVLRRGDDPVVVECCPSSNIAIGDYEGFHTHPLARFLNENLRCTINTDDPGIFVSSVEEEFISLAATRLYTPAVLQHIRDVGLARTAMGMPDAGCDWRFYDDLFTRAYLG
ncbi:MAG TPA: hypothetical protein VGX25_01505 [Actinophytocola sp.]|uniref:hypothetical protein n=1 Tax=Actinophytocola sp. TaxID=1872138 RepID=UPI002DDCBAD3|nr:hypothetical protein [Actinophytocola sp.]HEV2778053.1 hypothetical protein [Actinophytocola sp.]